MLEESPPAGQVLNLDLAIDAHANSTGLLQTVELWNFVTGVYDLLGTQAASLNSDSLQSVSAGGTLASYVEPGTFKVRAKVSWNRSGFVLVYPWSISVDEIDFSIRTR